MEGQYSEKVMEHFRNPRNVGEIPDANGIGNVGNPVCVAEGTLIRCNPSVSTIENIKQGKSRVLGHDGKYHRVKRVFKRNFKGKIFRIFVTESRSVALTAGHHMLSARGKIYDWVMPEELTKGDPLLLPISKSKRTTDYDLPVKPWSDKFYYVTVKKIITEEYDGYVYDLEIEGTHSYTADCATLHNCGDIMRLYIKVDENEVITDAKFKTFGCLSSDSDVVTAKGTWNRIGSINKGDTVITSAGITAGVAETYKNKYLGPILDIMPFVSPFNSFSATFNHPILAVKREGLSKTRKASNKCNLLRVDKKELCSTRPDYIEAKYLGKGDYLVFNVNREVKDDPVFTRDIMRLLGYYLSEGYIIAKDSAVAFAFNKNEKRTIEDLKSLLFKKTGKIPKERIRDNVCEVYICSRKLASFLKSHCGSLAGQKILSIDVMLLPYNKQKEMLKTYLIGDGNFYRRRPADSFTYRASTTSRNLAVQLQEILARGGIFSSIKKMLKNETHIGGRRIKPSIMYGISFKLERKHQFVHVSKNYFLVPIRNMTRRNYEGRVYNLNVEGANSSYLVKGFAVHNCGAAIATSSMVTELVKGKTIEEALKVSNHAVAEALGGLPKIKMHCSVLAEQALRSAIDDYLAKKKG
jgi:NifU-like protein involved in Fe-S cluster formation